jgi:hypothetical protein
MSFMLVDNMYSCSSGPMVGGKVGGGGDGLGWRDRNLVGRIENRDALCEKKKQYMCHDNVS